MFQRPALAGLIILSLAAATAAPQSPWPMFRHDRRHTGATVYTGPAEPIFQWAFQANDGITSSPSIGHNGTIYVGAGGYFGGGGDSALYALNRDGSLKWQFKTGAGATVQEFAGIYSSPAIDDNGTIYIGSLDGSMYAVEDSVTYGKLRWQVTPNVLPIYNSPAVSPDGRIYFGNLNAYIYCYDRGGNQIWESLTGWCVFSSPCIANDGTAYCGSKDHGLYSFAGDNTSGVPEWSYFTGTFYDGHLADASPAIGDDGTIYFATDPFGAFGQTPVPIDTAFYAVNPDGTLKWCLEIGSGLGIESSPAIAPNGTIYIGSYDSCLYAIADEGTQGTVLWTFETGGAVDASPTVDGDGNIYIGSNDSVMYALDPNGNIRWTYRTNGRIESSVTIDERGFMYFGNFDGKLYCLGSGAPDVGLTGGTFPEVPTPGEDFVPSVTAVNYRRAEATIEVRARILQDGVEISSQSVSGVTLGDAERFEVLFPAWTVTGDGSENYVVEYQAILSADDNLANNRVTYNPSSCCTGRVGDANNSGNDEPTIGDVSVLIDLLYISMDPSVVTCIAEADINLSGGLVPLREDITIGDISYLIDYLFITGPTLGLYPCP